MNSGGSVLLVGLLVGAAAALVVVPGATAPRADPVVASSEPVLSSVEPLPPGEPLSPGEPPGPSPVEPPVVGPGAAVPSADDLTAAAPNAKLGVLVYDRETAKTLAEHRGTAPFTSASVVKLLIALDALDSGAAAPSTVERMLARSDDGVASEIWANSGGRALVSRWAKRIRLPSTRPPEDPGRWGDTTVTAADVGRIYRYLLERAPSRSREVILRGLRTTSATGADGFPQHFGIPDAVGDRPWAVKQGWACCRPRRQLHTTGLVGTNDRYIVVVLSDHPESVTYPTAAKRITEVVTALRPLLDQPGTR